MRTFFLHTCKRVVSSAVVLSMLLSASGPLFCSHERAGAQYTNVTELNDHQKQQLKLLLNTVGTRAIREDSRAPREDALSFPGSKPSEIVGGGFDDATLKLMQECLCIIKNCVQQIKKGLVFDPSEEWASLIDKIACSMIDNPDLPMNLAEGQAQLAEGLATILCRIGCPLNPDNIFEFLNLILLKICTVDSKVDVIDNEIGTIFSKICTIDSKIDVIDDEVGTVFSKICTIDSKIDVIDNEVGTVFSKICTIDSKIDIIDDGFSSVFSKVCTLDSKVDVIDVNVEFAVSKICVIDSKIDELFVDFQETWTVIGANADPVPTPNAILDVNATTTYTVLQWLKAIYHKVK